MHTVDLGILVALLGFSAWGAWRGPLRPLLALGLLATSFAVAGALAGPLTPTATRVTGLSVAASEAVAWGASWFGTLVVGGVLLAVAKPWIGRVGAGGGVGRLAGAGLGFVQGAAWCAILTYLLLGWGSVAGPTRAPSLSRSAGARDASDPTWAHAWRSDVGASRTGAVAARVGSEVRARVDLPPWLADRMAAVERTLSEE